VKYKKPMQLLYVMMISQVFEVPWLTASGRLGGEMVLIWRNFPRRGIITHRPECAPTVTAENNIVLPLWHGSCLIGQVHVRLTSKGQPSAESGKRSACSWVA
jgi:hypothetical protein